MEPEMYTKMLRNLSEKLRAKFPATTRGYSMVNIARLNDAFSEVCEREASPVGQSLQQKDKKRRKWKAKKLKFWFLRMPEQKQESQNTTLVDIGRKKGMLSCWKCLFD